MAIATFDLPEWRAWKDEFSQTLEGQALKREFDEAMEKAGWDESMKELRRMCEESRRTRKLAEQQFLYERSYRRFANAQEIKAAYFAADRGLRIRRWQLESDLHTRVHPIVRDYNRRLFVIMRGWNTPTPV